MISHYKVPAFLQNSLPEMNEELVKRSIKGNLYNPFLPVQCLTDFTLQNAKEHNNKMLRRCFAAADKLYTKGNEFIRQAVESVFIHSLSLLFAGSYTSTERRQLQRLVPVRLYAAYVSQITRSGC